MPYIFLDESGQFTKYKNEKYFIVGSFTVGNPRRTEKQFRSWQRTKFPRKLRHQPEIKFSEIKIGNDFRLKTLKFIANLDNYIAWGQSPKIGVEKAILIKENKITFQHSAECENVVK